jgi:predicted O-methyltransferase YrrM
MSAPEWLHELAGFDQPVERDELYRLAGKVPANLAIVELGTYQGKGTCFLAAGARAGKGAFVWTVDPWDLPGERSTTGAGPRPENPIDYTDPAHRETAVRQVVNAGLSGQVTFVQDFSSHAGRIWSGPPVGLLFIDGDHREPAVRRDFAAWEPHLAPGAVIAWDDHRVGFPGVMSVVDQLAHDKGLITAPELVGSLAVTRVVR